MQALAMNVDALTPSEILDLLELFRNFSVPVRDWRHLRQKISAGKALLLNQENTIAGCALMQRAPRYMDGAAILTAFVYRWDYNKESDISAMLSSIAEACRPQYFYLLMDVNQRHELNLECYRRFGFQDAIWPSPKGKENRLLIADLAKVK